MALTLSAKPACLTRLQWRGQDQLAPSILTIAVMEGAAFRRSVSRIILHDYQYFPPECHSEKTCLQFPAGGVYLKALKYDTPAKNSGHLSSSKRNQENETNKGMEGKKNMFL